MVRKREGRTAICGRHGQVRYVVWLGDYAKNESTAGRPSGPTGTGEDQVYIFCPLCFGEWLARSFPVVEEPGGTNGQR